jgi:hypothetical protein
MEKVWAKYPSVEPRLPNNAMVGKLAERHLRKLVAGGIPRQGAFYPG